MRFAWVAVASIASVLVPSAALHAQTAMPAVTFTATPATPGPLPYPTANHTPNYKPVIIIDPATLRRLLATPTPRPHKMTAKARARKPVPKPTNTYETFSTIKN